MKIFVTAFLSTMMLMVPSSVLGQSGCKITDLQCRFDYADLSGDGVLDFAEYALYVGERYGWGPVDASFTFQNGDVDGDNLLTFPQFVRAITGGLV
ncbi:MAG: EF-hand domain-containing protein [Pseudomonadota bacterium]